MNTLKHPSPRPSLPALLECLVLGDGGLSERLRLLLEEEDGGPRYEALPCALRGVWCGLALLAVLWALVAALAGAC